ncbi:hypothetical protein BaRGS_00027468, partial [Batillaria attramentaria]
MGDRVGLVLGGESRDAKTHSLDVCRQMVLGGRGVEDRKRYFGRFGTRSLVCLVGWSLTFPPP